MTTLSLFQTNAHYRLWKYAVIVSDTRGNLYVKDGDTRSNTKDEALDYAASETIGKSRGLMEEDDILGVWDMTAHAKTIGKDPSVDVDTSRGYDDDIRDIMPLKRRLVKNFRGQNSLELHPIPKDLMKDPNWRSLLAFMWDSKHQEILNGGIPPDLAEYTARNYLVDSFNKVELATKFLLAAATGAGKETSTLALHIYLHDVKNYNNKTLNVAVATIPSTVSELMNELATVSGMEVPGYGFIDFSRIKVYIMRQWYNAYKADCSNIAKTMMSARATIVDSVSDIPATHTAGVVPVLFGSYHDLAQKSGNKLNSRYEGLESRIGTLSIGEAHQMLSTADNKMWKSLESAFGKKCFKLFVTGTPYDFIYGSVAAEFFSVEERALFTRNDLYRDKRTNPKSDFLEYPNFNYYGIDVADIVAKLKEDPNWKDDAEGFTYTKLFNYDPESKKFTYEKTILWLFKRMFGSSAFDENGDPLSIYNAPELCEKAKQHIMVALPVGNKNASAKVYIGALKSLLIKHGVFEGTIFEAYDDGLGDRKDDIKNAAGRTMTLTCIKDCTGANIPELGSFVFLRTIGDSVKFFEQATGRIGRKFPGKTNCGVFIGDLEAAMNLMVTIEEKISSERGNDFSTREIIEDVIGNYNFFSGKGGNWKKMEIPDFATILEELNARGRYGIGMCVHNTTPPVGFNEIVSKDNTRKESSKVNLTSNGNDNAKNNNTTSEQVQAGLPFGDDLKLQKSWIIIKRKNIAAIRKIAYIKNMSTIQDIVAWALKNPTESKKYFGKGFNYIQFLLDPTEIDINYTNKWILKLNLLTGIDNVLDEIEWFDSNGAQSITEAEHVNALLLHITNSDLKSKDTKYGNWQCGSGLIEIYLFKMLMKSLSDCIPDELEREKHIWENQIYMSDIDPLQISFAKENISRVCRTKNLKLNITEQDCFKNALKTTYTIGSIDFKTTNAFVPYYRKLSDHVIVITQSNSHRYVEQRLNEIYAYQFLGRAKNATPMCIIHIDKNKTSKDVVFIDGDQLVTKTNPKTVPTGDFLGWQYVEDVLSKNFEGHRACAGPERPKVINSPGSIPMVFQPGKGIKDGKFVVSKDKKKGAVIGVNKKFATERTGYNVPKLLISKSGNPGQKNSIYWDPGNVACGANCYWVPMSESEFTKFKKLWDNEPCIDKLVRVILVKCNSVDFWSKIPMVKYINELRKIYDNYYKPNNS